MAEAPPAPPAPTTITAFHSDEIYAAGANCLGRTRGSPRAMCISRSGTTVWSRSGLLEDPGVPEAEEWRLLDVVLQALRGPGSCKAGRRLPAWPGDAARLVPPRWFRTSHGLVHSVRMAPCCILCQVPQPRQPPASPPLVFACVFLGVPIRAPIGFCDSASFFILVIYLFNNMFIQPPLDSSTC